MLEPREICIQLPTASAISDIATASIPNLWPNQMPTNCVPAVKVFAVGCKTHLSLYMMRMVITPELGHCRNKAEHGGLYCQSVLYLTYSGVNRLQPTELGLAARHAIVSLLFSACFFKTQETV